jgi:hypothetical protein
MLAVVAALRREGDHVEVRLHCPAGFARSNYSGRTPR